MNMSTQELLYEKSEKSTSLYKYILGIVASVSIAGVVVGGLAYSKANSLETSGTCNPTGYYKCIQGSYCVGIENFAQNTGSYYSSTSNGVEFDKLSYLPASKGSAPSDYFVHMQIHGGCASTPCGFNENELYTSVPGSTFNYEGFTVNRTGADLGQQVFYENVYFNSECNSYTKIVKGQVVGDTGLKPAAVMCRNICSRTSEEDYKAGIKGGYINK